MNSKYTMFVLDSRGRHCSRHIFVLKPPYSGQSPHVSMFLKNAKSFSSASLRDNPDAW